MVGPNIKLTTITLNINGFIKSMYWLANPYSMKNENIEYTVIYKLEPFVICFMFI